MLHNTQSETNPAQQTPIHLSAEVKAKLDALDREFQLQYSNKVRRSALMTDINIQTNG